IFGSRKNFVVRPSFLEALEDEIQIGAILASGGVRGIHGDGAFERVKRFASPRELDQGEPAIEPAVRGLRIERQASLVSGQAFLVAAELEEEMGALNPTVRLVGRKLRQFLNGRERLLAALELHQHPGAVLPTLGVGRRNADSLLEREERF